MVDMDDISDESTGDTNLVGAGWDPEYHIKPNLLQRVHLHLSEEDSVGWNWKAEELLEELDSRLKDKDLPPRLKKVYIGLKLELLARLSVYWQGSNLMQFQRHGW